jgi:hypothetical protein
MSNRRLPGRDKLIKLTTDYRAQEVPDLKEPLFPQKRLAEDIRDFKQEARDKKIPARKNVPLHTLNPHDYIPRKRRVEGAKYRQPTRSLERSEAIETELFGQKVRVMKTDARSQGEIVKISEQMQRTGVRDDRILAVQNHLAQLVEQGLLSSQTMHESIMRELTSSNTRVSAVLTQLDESNASLGAILRVHQELTDIERTRGLRQEDIKRVLDELAESGAVKAREDLVVKGPFETRGRDRLVVPVNSPIYNALLDARLPDEPGLKLMIHSGSSIIWASEDRRVRSPEATAALKAAVAKIQQDGAGGFDTEPMSSSDSEQGDFGH